MAHIDPEYVAQALAHVTQAIDDPAEEPVHPFVAPYYALVRVVVAQNPRV